MDASTKPGSDLPIAAQPCSTFVYHFLILHHINKVLSKYNIKRLIAHGYTIFIPLAILSTIYGRTLTPTEVAIISQ